MKTPISTSVFLLLALVGVASADLPKKPSLQKYSGLWTNSPFTAKPPPPPSGEEVNPLDDYALLGVSSLGVKNYLVTLINKKKPDEPRIYVESHRDSKGFKIIKVTRKDGDPLGTVVLMQSGSMTGTVSYDQKLLTLTPAAAKPAAPQPGQPPQGGPQLVPGEAQRLLRPRPVPPPTPGANGQIQPQVLPGQVQPGQPLPANQQNRGNTQRPQLRGNN